MNWKSLMFTLGGIVLGSSTMNAQTNLLNATTPQEIGQKTEEQVAADNDKPLPYGYIDDRDMLWSKVVWEYIDLNERLNLPYYYPIHEASTSKNRKSLYQTLLDDIVEGELTEIYDDSYFTTKLTKEEIESKLFRVDTLDAGFEAIEYGEDPSEFIEQVNITPKDIVGFKIKGVWYIDKRQGELKYRLLAIAPVAPDVQTKGRDDMESENLAMFWVWYPSSRDLLHNMKIFNQKNSAFPISFDHMMNARRFTATIYREENLYGNREVKDYVKGNALFQVLESDRIRESIREKELDLWNY